MNGNERFVCLDAFLSHAGWNPWNNAKECWRKEKIVYKLQGTFVRNVSFSIPTFNALLHSKREFDINQNWHSKTFSIFFLWAFITPLPSNSTHVWVTISRLSLNFDVQSINIKYQHHNITKVQKSARRRFIQNSHNS